MDYLPSPHRTCPTLNVLAVQMIPESLLESSLNFKLPSSSWAQCRDRVFSSHTMSSTVYCALLRLFFFVLNEEHKMKEGDKKNAGEASASSLKDADGAEKTESFEQQAAQGGDITLV
jgi:hypothetical protein